MKNLILTTLLLLSATTFSVASMINTDFFSLNFECITNNNLTNAQIGESQFTLGITNEGVDENQIMFVFSNQGPDQSVISEIYFDNDSPELLSFDSFNEIDVVDIIDYNVGADPSNLPGGQTISFTADDSFEPSKPQPKNGINVGESLGIVFTLGTGETFDSIIEALCNDEIVVGIHSIGFANDGSESFVTKIPPVSVPEPSTISLMLLGLLSIAFARKRKK